MLFYNNKNFFRGTGKEVSSGTNNNDVPAEEVLPDSTGSDNPDEISRPPPPSPAASSPSPPSAQISPPSPPPAQISPPPWSSDCSPSPAPPVKPFPVYLQEHGLQIRTNILETESGNCW